MTPTQSPVEEEIGYHKSDLTTWIESVKAFDTLESREGVVERSVRDCNLLIGDLEKEGAFTTSDLVDFTERRNSLEIQYLNIYNDVK